MDPNASDPLMLYSTNTRIAIIIAKKYYNNTHYMYCTTDFDPEDRPSIERVTPPSSSPKSIYKSLCADVQRADLHSSKIEQNRAGIIRGSVAMFEEGVINESEMDEIQEIVQSVPITEFKPILCVMPYKIAKDYSSAVPISERAHQLSDEYIVSNFPRIGFDAIDLGVIQ